MKAIFRLFTLQIICAVVLATGVSGNGYALEPSAEELKLLNQLSPDQLQDVLRMARERESSAVIPRQQNRVVPVAVSAPDARPARESAMNPYRTSSSALRPFGYDIFASAPSTFAPATDIPVPVDYVIGPGDVINVQLFGKQNLDYALTVSRDGSIAFPGVGPIALAGLRFDEMRETLNRQIAEQFIGLKASITVGPLRSIRIFVLGDVRQPGSYTVSALSTMTNALFVSGGVNEIGSLRKIQLKRRGKVVTTLDIYDLLLHGDTSGDSRLQPGDVIFVPPVGAMVGVDGEVRRPAFYEIDNQLDVAAMVELAGGLLPRAYPKEVRLERIDEQHARTLLDVDLSDNTGKKTAVVDGDVIRVYSVLEKLENIVLLSGHVYRPLTFQWHDGMRLTDLIPSLDELRPNADIDYLLIKRERMPERSIEVVSANLASALASPDGAANIALRSKDEVMVFGIDSDRHAQIDPVLAKLKLQAQQGQPALIVTVGGHVRFPGDYPLEPAMKLSDLLRAGGRLQESAYTLSAELTRREVIDGSYRDTAHLNVDLAAVLAGDATADIALQPHDILHIKEMPQWGEQEYVELRGEVRFPGRYPIKRGETMTDLVQRAGGLTDEAFPEGAVFLREALRQREQERLKTMAKNLDAELVSLSIERTSLNPEQQQAFHFIKRLEDQLLATEAMGRLVINLEKILAEQRKRDQDIVLKDGDKLFIPARMNEVTVLGEVFSPTSHLYDDGLSQKNYINMSGGMTPKADDDNVYVIKANGSVIAAQAHHGRARIRPGDTIVVPLDTRRVGTLKLWTDVTQVMYQLALTAASLKTIGVF